MKNRAILAVVFLSVTIVSLVVVVSYRVQQLPSLLTISVTFGYLTRNRDYSYASGRISISMQLTTTNETADNVTLVPPPYSNQTTNAYWRMQIVLNESTTPVAPWLHDIESSNHTAGDFAGTVSKSFLGLNGNFTVWIIVWAVYQDSTTMDWWISDETTIH